MKNKFKKNIAMTLAEVMIVFLIIGIVATLTTIAINKTTTRTVNKNMTTAAFVNLQTVIGEIIATSSNRTLPATGISLCTSITNIFNTAGNIDCNQTATDGSTFSTASLINFKTTNGMKFYNFGTNAVGPNADGSSDFFIYVDIDGANRNSVLDTDVIKFQINTKGQVLPAYNSIAATNIDYLSAGVKYKIKATSVIGWLVESTNYRNAICTAGLGIGTYCSLAPTIAANANCTNGTYICEIVLHKPKDFSLKK